MASVHLFNFFKHHPRESGNPPADGGLGPDFKDMSLVQLMAAYWKVKAWRLDVDITFTSDCCARRSMRRVTRDNNN